MILTIDGTEVILVNGHLELLQGALYEKAEKLFKTIPRQIFKGDRYMQQVLEVHKIMELYKATGKDPFMLSNKLTSAMIEAESSR